MRFTYVVVPMMRQFSQFAFAATDELDVLELPYVGDRLSMVLLLPDAGNFADLSAEGLVSPTLEGYDDHFPATAPSDSFRPNALGLLNMGGNVTEWMHDVYSASGSGGGKVEKDPVGTTSGAEHAIRGASWMDASVSELRLSYRDGESKPRPDLGFRIARYAE